MSFLLFRHSYDKTFLSENFSQDMVILVIKKNIKELHSIENEL